MGSILHVYSRGVEQRDIFLNDLDRRVFRVFMREALRTHDVGLLAYCLMGNHFHLLVAVGQHPVWRGMHRLLMRYSGYFNQKYQRVGHLFQGRFQSILCLDDAYLIHLVAYIHKNPVRAGLVAHPRDWAWSSHGEFSGGAQSFIELGRLGQATGFTPEELQQRYAERLSESNSMLPLKLLAAQAAGIAGVSLEKLLNGGSDAVCTRARRLLLAMATNEGYTLCDVAKLLGCSESALSQLRRKSQSNKECPTA